MSQSKPSLVQRALMVDALISGAMGLLLAIGAGLVGSLLGLPEALARYAGLSLLPFAAMVLFIATRETPPRGGVWLVIAMNAMWALDSIVPLFTGWVEPTGLGYAFVIAQAIIVGAFAEAQYVGLRRTVLAA